MRGRDNPLILDDGPAANVLAVPVDGHDGRPVRRFVAADNADSLVNGPPQIRAASWPSAVDKCHYAVVAGLA